MMPNHSFNRTRYDRPANSNVRRLKHPPREMKVAFDMLANGNHESIGHHEEFLFTLATEREERYPELLAIWESFYDSPRISARQAGALVHELVELLTQNGGLANKSLAAVVARLLPFFSLAYKSNQEVRCTSD